MTKYICNICGYVYDGEDFLKEDDDYKCPLCDQGKEAFHERSFDHEENLATDEYHRNK
ncbi:MAG: rubredoxin/rubrerythrin [Longicatena sp.]